MSGIDVSRIPDLPGFDKHAGRMWIYPTNYPVREYQYAIVKEALFKNTMVVLPTGLGKTFIAAVVMYNFYRWYPQVCIIVSPLQMVPTGLYNSIPLTNVYGGYYDLVIVTPPHRSRDILKKLIGLLSYFICG